MRIIKGSVVAALLLVASFQAGCATMFSGGNETIRIESVPPGATVVTQNGLTLGTTPLLTSLKPADYILRFTLPGYAESTVAVGRTVDGVAFLNLLCVLCWGIDLATGSMWGMDTEFVNVTLNRQTALLLYGTSTPLGLASDR